ncbi:MAG: Extracellular basic protease [Luteibacter sp.]|uniref:S8 family peptidase n=1 Tax=Luteibacter sp. TaxID=1886636 RepID=UPI00137D90AB|nr:S8 family peptidase [Luteibacter sp.]KAF1009630.1 MAG: Extracellular basic protease [Luteibacter sp.]
MRRFVSTLAIALTVSCTTDTFATTRFIVRFAPDYMPPATTSLHGRARRSAALMREPVQPIRRLATGDALYEQDSADPSALAAMPGVVSIEEDRLLQLTAMPDPLWRRQWYMHDPRYGTDVEVAWRHTRGVGAVVAVIDSGIVPHAEFAGRLLPGYDFLSDADEARDGDGRDADPTDEGDWRDSGDCGSSLARPSSWHGTHVAGLAMARGGNRYGMVGVAPEAMLLPVRVAGMCGAWTSDIVDAITWASGGDVEGVPPVERRADVINLSLGGQGACGEALATAITAARERGSVVVVAAGNDGVKASAFAPANCPGVVSVGALGRDGAQAWYSNHGDGLTLSAPGGSKSGVRGDDIVSALDLGRTVATRPVFGYLAGTSMAAPQVAGLVALMRSADPAIGVDEVGQQLVDNARPVQGRCPKGCGAGVMDAGATVDAVVEDRERRGATP